LQEWLNVRHPSFRRDDESVALNLQAKIARPGYMSKFFLAIHVFPGQQWTFAGMTVRGIAASIIEIKCIT